MIFHRHLGQIKAVLGMIVMWLLLGIVNSSPWTWYLMVPALLCIAIVYLLTLKQYAKRPNVLGQPVLVSVKASLAQVEHQIWLMRSLGWWNLLPVAVAMMAYFAHSTWGMSLPWWGRVLVIGLWAFLLYYGFRWMSRMIDLSVQKELEPRRSDLKKIISSLESENAGGEHELQDIIIGLTENDARSETQYDTAKAIETWNRLIPSWREVICLVVPTLASAYCTTLFKFDSMRTRFIQSTRVASVTFAIVLVILCIVANRRIKNPPSTGSEDTGYSAPAKVTMWLIMIMVMLGSVALLAQPTKPESQPLEKSNNIIEPGNDSR